MKASSLAKVKRNVPLHIMLLPAVILVLIYSYGPMLGIVMAFQRFIPGRGLFGSPYIGFRNFSYVFNLPGFGQVIWNTVFISFLKIITGIIVPVTFALLLNEVISKMTKKMIQTMIYLPFFMSWVIMAGILRDILSPSTGIINRFLIFITADPIYFLADAEIFPWVIVISHIWKEFGYATIIYLATLTTIDPTLYEAAMIDGAGRLKQTLHVTIPGIASIVVLMSVLSLGNVLNAGFDQVFNLYNFAVYSTGDILDTFIYRVSLENLQFGVGTAVGLFKSLVSFVFVVTSYWLAAKLVNYRVF
jgi:putative aldouronate transport system permease protein